MPENLANEPFVHFPRYVAPSLFEQIAEICRNAGFAPRIVLEAREWLTEISLVEAGLGIAIVPASFGRLELGDVKFVPLQSQVQSLIVLCYLRENIKPTVSAFVEIVQKFT